MTERCRRATRALRDLDPSFWAGFVGVFDLSGVQLASAMANGCPTFLTNDLGLPGLPSLRVVQLDAYLPRG
ncbi:MAG: hypothetical protein ACQEXJ_06665 [Myxococcota bacterium]